MEVNVNSKKWFLVLGALSLLALIGCTVAVPSTPVVKPAIASFAASPTGINQGEQTTLSWAVSGATTISIEPAIGSVGASGSLTLTPNATTTYTLTASNEAGSATSSTTVNVTPVVAGKPDLVITDISLQGTQIYYTIKNQGNAVAPQSTSYLYVNGQKESSNFVDSLAPGEERIQRFSNFEWTYSSLIASDNPQISNYVVYDIQVCANAVNPIAESNTGNDCLIQSLGPGFTYDFVQQAHLAKWTSGAGDLFWPMSADYTTGAAYLITYSPILVICPEKVNQGWILGKYGAYHYDPDSHIAEYRDIDIPVLCQFTSKVGFAPGVTSPDGVTVALGYYDQMGSLVFFNKMPVMSDGQMHDYNVDLSSMAGKHTQFVLFVQANGSPENTCVRWDSPKITQQSGGF
jgi:hypothetical protein